METLLKEKHMSTVRMVILDFDGTLADTAAVIIRTMQATISEMGLPCRTDKQCAAMIGLRLVEIPSALFPLISYILGADDVNKGKPDPEPVNRTLQRFGIHPDEAIVVGDTSFDIQMGRNAGTHTCGVTYGNGSMESLSDADWIIDDFGKLLDIVSE